MEPRRDSGKVAQPGRVECMASPGRESIRRQKRIETDGERKEEEDRAFAGCNVISARDDDFRRRRATNLINEIDAPESLA